MREPAEDVPDEEADRIHREVRDFWRLYYHRGEDWRPDDTRRV